MSTDRSDLFEPTARIEAAARFRRARPTLRWVGLLTPIAGLSTRKIRIDRDELTLGRDKSLPIPLQDESVSRHHARITRNGDQFVLEDLQSFNCTHVDGVPVIRCLLRDGDAVQVGQTLYIFERLLEQAGTTQGEKP